MRSSRSYSLFFTLLFLATTTITTSFDGYFSLNEMNQQYEYHLLSFSNMDYPRSPMNFTIIREGNFCDPSNIVGPIISIAAIVNHGPCNIYIEAQHLLSVGYKYVIIANYDIQSSNEEEYPIDQMVISTPMSLTILQAKYDVKSLEVSISPHNVSTFICICTARSQLFVDQGFISSLYSLVSTCISHAINDMKKEGRTYHFIEEISAAVSLSQLMLTLDMVEDVRILSRWISLVLLSNKRNSTLLYSSNLDYFAGLVLDLISTLFTIGEWSLARQLLAFETIESCGSKNFSQNTYKNCFSVCSVVFVSTFGTLQSPIISDSQANEYTDDWTIASTEFEPTKDSIQPLTSDTLTVCLDFIQSFVELNGSNDRLNYLFLDEVDKLKSHPVLWLSANEFSYLLKKYGIINPMAYLHQALRFHDFSIPTSNSHILEYQQFVESLDSCSRSDDTCLNMKNLTGIRFDSMPVSSQSTLKKNIKFGRSKRKVDLLNEVVAAHLGRDFIDIHTRFSVYWDEYGSFVTSQRHTLLRISTLFCQENHMIDGCPSPDSLLMISCLYERSIVATPMIFASFDEFRSYRTSQISALSSISSIISKTSLSNRDAKHFEVLSAEAQITTTPPSMMIGYQFEIQDMGDRALAPAMSVFPSSFDILGHRHQSDLLCHSSLPLSEVSTPPRLIHSGKMSRIRVGFLSRYFYEHSVGRLIEGVITLLDQRKFESYVFCICCSHQSDGKDDLQQRLRSSTANWIDVQNQKQSSFECSHQFLSNPDEYTQALSIVTKQKLDLLIYPELGMDTLTLLFASKRLAPVQVVYWGHPVSQNLPTIDYFVTSSLFDVHNPKCQYPRLGHEKCPIGFLAREQVVHLDGLTTVFPPVSLIEDVPKNPFEKYKSLLNVDRRNDMHIYLLPHTIMKYSSAYIRSLATLLLKDESGVLIILYGSNQALWFQKLQLSIKQQVKKLYCQIKTSDHEILSIFPEHSLVPSKYAEISLCILPSCGICCDCTDSYRLQSIYKRIVMVPKVTRQEYLSILKHGSVLLDPFPFGMGVTAFETFTCGLPIVTLPSYQSTPALVYGMINKMELNISHREALIASSPIDYVENAIRVATVGNFRNQILDSIQKASHRLYNDNSTISEWEEFIQRVVVSVNDKGGTAGMSGTGKRKSSKSLEGYCFAISGTLSIGRKEFENLITENGGEIAKTVTKKCTHLISSATGTKKCQDAESKGVIVVDEDWVRAQIDGGAGDTPAPKKTKKGGSSILKSSVGDSSKPLLGLTFAITGTLSVSRKDFEKFIVSNGGQVAKSVTNKVTHLVSSESGTKKCEEAEEKGVKIVDEDWVRDKVDGVEQNSDDEDKEEESDENDDDNIEERYQPPSQSYPHTSIFDADFLNSFWETPPDESSTGTPVTNEMFYNVEEQLGFKLPASYIELIRSQNGGRPKLHGFRVGRPKLQNVEIEDIMGCDKDCENSLIGGSGSEFYMEEWEYPRIGIYFGNCPSGGHDLICLDYRKCGVAGEPEVTHVDQELDYQKVVIAPSFEAFVRGLIASEDLED